MTRGSHGGIAALALLAGCAHAPPPRPEPVLNPVEVAVPVATGCVPANLADAPNYPDTDDALRAASDASFRYQLIYAGRKLRVGRLAEIETIVAGCQKGAAK